METKNAHYLLFVGSGRTGSTLVGQLLNYHPQFLISNEIRVLDRAVKSGTGVEQFYKEITQDSATRLRRTSPQKHFNFFGALRERLRYKKWQRDWRDTSASYRRSPLRKSNSIRYIGDKKQGGNTSLIIRDRAAVINAMKMVTWVPISVLRDPREIVMSSLRINASQSDVLRGLQHFESGIEFVQEQDGIFVDYNRLLENSHGVAVELCEKLGVVQSSGGLRLVNATVKKSKRTKISTTVFSRSIARELSRATDIWKGATGR